MKTKSTQSNMLGAAVYTITRTHLCSALSYVQWKGQSTMVLNVILRCIHYRNSLFQVIHLYLRNLILKQQRWVYTLELTQGSILWCFEQWDSGPLEYLKWDFFPSDLLGWFLKISEGNWIEKKECGWVNDDHHFDPIGKFRSINHSALEKVVRPLLIPIRQSLVKIH